MIYFYRGFFLMIQQNISSKCIMIYFPSKNRNKNRQTIKTLRSANRIPPVPQTIPLQKGFYRIVQNCFSGKFFILFRKFSKWQSATIIVGQKKRENLIHEEQRMKNKIK